MPEVREKTASPGPRAQVKSRNGATPASVPPRPRLCSPSRKPRRSTTKADRSTTYVSDEPPSLREPDGLAPGRTFRYRYAARLGSSSGLSDDDRQGVIRWASAVAPGVGGVPKWTKGTDCKSVIRGFESHRRLWRKARAGRRRPRFFRGLLLVGACRPADTRAVRCGPFTPFAEGFLTHVGLEASVHKAITRTRRCCVFPRSNSSKPTCDARSGTKRSKKRPG